MIDSKSQDGIITITLNRPDKLNAFAGSMREDLLDALEHAEKDTSCRVIILTGAGRAFSAGGDVDFMRGLQKRGDVAGLEKLLAAGSSIVQRIVTMTRPVIASVNGVAAGAGCNLALACDYRIASQLAKMSQAFVRIGMHPDWGGTWLLPRLVGRSRALEIFLTGRMIEAQEALALGMVDRVVPHDTLEEETMRLAREFAAAPPVAVAGIKRALSACERNEMAAQLEVERRNQVEAFRTADAAEGMTAFVEKRKAVFRGE